MKGWRCQNSSTKTHCLKKIINLSAKSFGKQKAFRIVEGKCILKVADINLGISSVVMYGSANLSSVIDTFCYRYCSKMLFKWCFNELIFSPLFLRMNSRYGFVQRFALCLLWEPILYRILTLLYTRFQMAMLFISVNLLQKRIKMIWKNICL